MCDFSTVQVLVVDDSPIWRRSLIAHLRNAGLRRIDVAYDGVQAVYKARTLQPDVILMDVRLPHMDGIQAAEIISGVAPEAKIVFVSAVDDPDVKRQALDAGGHDYVVKTLAGRDLVQAIRLVSCRGQCALVH